MNIMARFKPISWLEDRQIFKRYHGFEIIYVSVEENVQRKSHWEGNQDKGWWP
jgi:hypothetical protein